MPASTVFRSFLEAQELGSRRKAREDEAARLQQERELSQAASAGGIQSLAFQQLIGTNPNLASKIGGLLGDIGVDREEGLFKDARELNSLLKRNKSQDGLAFINSRLNEGDRLAAETGKAFDPKDTLEIRDLILQDRMPEAIELLNSVEQAGIQSGLLKDLKVSQDTGVSADQRSFERNLKLAGIKPGTKKFQDAIEVKLRLQAGAVGSAAQTIASTGTAQQVGESQGVIKGAEEAGKLKAKLRFEPQVKAAIKLAEAAAAEKGEVLTDLARLEAGLPGLTDAVGQLRILSKVATSTFGGRMYDVLVKESGFGATRGKTARTKFIAIVSNQILPLLKPTFGGSFTVEEGKKLEATLGDPDNSIDEKMAALDAFMDQNERNIRGKKLQLGGAPATPAQSGVMRFDAEGNLIP